MSKNHPAIKKKTQYKKLPSRHVLLACRRAQLRRFWHVDRHRRHFGMSTGTTLASFWHVDGHEYVVLACRLAHLLCYTLRFSLSNLLFGIAGRQFGMSTGHFGMSTGTSTILRFTTLPVPPTSWHRGASFWHVHGVILACPWAHFLFQYYFTLFSLATLLFGIVGTFTILHFTIILSNLLFGIGGRHFGMSTGTSTRFVMPTGTCTILHFTILPVQPTYSWHRGASFWHVDGVILACQRTHLLFHTLLSPFPTFFLASWGVFLAF